MQTQCNWANLPEETQFLIAQQLPAIKHCLTIATNCGEIHITDSETITEIKAVIERRAVSWN